MEKRWLFHQLLMLIKKLLFSKELDMTKVILFKYKNFSYNKCKESRYNIEARKSKIR